MRFGGGSFTIGNLADSPTAVKIGSFELDMQNVQAPRADIAADTEGVLHIWLPDCDPILRIEPELDNVATYPFESIFRSGLGKAVSLVLGDGTDKATFTLPSVQPIEIPMGDREGTRVYNWAGRCINTSGSNAVKLEVAADA